MLNKQPPDIINGASFLLQILQDFEGALKHKKDLDVSKKLGKYLYDLGTPLMLQTRMSKNLVTHPIILGKKVIAAVSSFASHEFPIVG